MVGIHLRRCRQGWICPVSLSMSWPSVGMFRLQHLFQVRIVERDQRPRLQLRESYAAHSAEQRHAAR